MIAVARKGKSQDRASGTVHVMSHISNESSHDNEMQETCIIYFVDMYFNYMISSQLISNFFLYYKL